MNNLSVTSTSKISGVLWKNALGRTDIALAMGLVMILAILIFPMPALMMDFSLTISITLSVMILMTSLFIEKPLEFSSFPTVLLVSTMIRLALNVASTRLILSNGHEGPHAAGKVIEAFGNFVMGGNYVIGIIVFAILVIINFVVITKGSGRIAEVSARFSLDAMPGKQMAIDADLSAGMINEEGARKRRKDLEAESNFYGAMDGAAKFVRGDAIAGLLITFINVIGGIVIGVMQNGMNLGNAAKTYTMLTVGDGLVSQIPALVVSTAAGLLVSKSGGEGSMDKALFSQLSAYPKALGMSSILMGFMAVLPGLPTFPFLVLSILTGFMARYLSKPVVPSSEALLLATNQEEAGSNPPSLKENKKEPSAVEEIVTPSIDPIRIELGYGLIPLLNQNETDNLTHKLRNLRKQLATELGIILPAIRLQDNLRLDSEEYVISVKELEAGRGKLKLNHLLIIDPEAGEISLEGEKTKEPSFGLPAVWVETQKKHLAEEKKYTIVTPAAVLTTHLAEIVKDNISELLTYADVQSLLDNCNEAYKKLLNDIVPAQVTVGNIQRILQNLINERVSIRDLSTILEGIAEGSSFSRNLTTITEHVRLRLGRQITLSHIDNKGYMTIATLHSGWEKLFVESLVGEGDNKQLAMAPTIMREFIKKVTNFYDRVAFSSEPPALVTSALIRPYVRSVLEKVKPSIIILSQSEIYSKINIRNLGSIEGPQNV